MELNDILDPKAIKVLSGCSSKKRLFQALGDMAENQYGIAADVVIDALVDRENLGPTSVGSGIALPHARLDGLERVHGVFILVDKPMDFDAVDRQPVDIVFALFAPEHAGVEHLKALALVSRTLRNKSVCAKLRANTDPMTLHMILTDTTTTKAA